MPYKTFYLIFSLLLLPFSYLEAQDAKTIEEGYVSIDGDAQLFYRKMGEGSPLVVIHGGPGISQDYLLPYMYELAATNQVIFYDQRGGGQSTGEVNAQWMTTERFIKDMEQLRQAFKFDKISILGHSWGGFLAMQYAIHYPERTEKLILSNSAAASSEETLLYLQEYQRRVTAFQTEIDILLIEIRNAVTCRPELIEQLHRMIFRVYCADPSQADKLDLSLSCKAAFNCYRINDIIGKEVFEHDYNLYDALAELPMPVLVIHGDVDPIPADSVQGIAQTAPKGQWVLIENCGHFPFIEKPPVYFEHISSFLKL